MFDLLGAAATAKVNDVAHHHAARATTADGKVLTAGAGAEVVAVAADGYAPPTKRKASRSTKSGTA